VTKERFLPWSPACEEYFSDFAGGRFDAESQLWFILPREQTSIDAKRGDFIVGSAGCDGIDFCFRRGHPGVWAYYPIDQDWVLKANSMAELERRWLDGSVVA
jgi:hypothetical protein